MRSVWHYWTVCAGVSMCINNVSSHCSPLSSCLTAITPVMFRSVLCHVLCHAKCVVYYYYYYLLLPTQSPVVGMLLGIGGSCMQGAATLNLLAYPRQPYICQPRCDVLVALLLMSCCSAIALFYGGHTSLNWLQVITRLLLAQQQQTSGCPGQRTC